MKKNQLFFTFLLTLSLCGCGKGPSITTSNSELSPTTSAPTTTSLSSSTEENAFEELQCTFKENLTNGWTYIGNDYSISPEYYTEGALKLKAEGTGILSPTFSPFTGRLRVAIKVDYLAKNIKLEAASEHVFTVTMLDSAKNTISERYVNTVLSAGNINLFIDGENATQISIIMSGYPKIDGICYNLGLSSITIKKA